MYVLCVCVWYKLTLTLFLAVVLADSKNQNEIFLVFLLLFVVSNSYTFYLFILENFKDIQNYKEFIEPLCIH